MTIMKMMKYESREVDDMRDLCSPLDIYSSNSARRKQHAHVRTFMELDLNYLGKYIDICVVGLPGWAPIEVVVDSSSGETVIGRNVFPGVTLETKTKHIYISVPGAATRPLQGRRYQPLGRSGSSSIPAVGLGAPFALR